MLNTFAKVFYGIKTIKMKKKKLKQIRHIIYFLGLHLGLINCYQIKFPTEGLLRIKNILRRKKWQFYVICRLTRKT